MLNQLYFNGDTLIFTGVNIIFGDNGTGKTYILNQVSKELNAFENVFRHTFEVSAAKNLPLELARLMSLPKKVILWDLPETGLNNKILKILPETIVTLLSNGIQVFLTTHSLFLLRELEMILAENKVTAQWIGLQINGDGKVFVEQGKHIDDAGDISALDEELMQSDRFMDSNFT